MSTSTVAVEKQGAVAVITLNRPDNSNTLNLELGMDLLAAALACERDTTTRAVILTGAGKNFCFGGDLRAMSAKNHVVSAYLREAVSYMNAAISHFMRMDAPLISAVNGTAAGAGVGFAIMADLTIAAQSSKFNLAYTSVGLTPDAATSFLLPHMIGAKRAMELLLLNRTIFADEALQWGLVNRVVPDEELLTEAMKLAQQLAEGPTRAFGKSKRLVAHVLGALETQLALEGEAIAAQAGTAEAKEGISAFLAKRKPHFS